MSKAELPNRVRDTKGEIYIVARYDKRYVWLIPKGKNGQKIARLDDTLKVARGIVESWEEYRPNMTTKRGM